MEGRNVASLANMNNKSHFRELIKTKLKLPLSAAQIKMMWRWIFFGALIGVVSGFGAILFNYLLQKGSQFFFIDLINLLLPGSLRDYSLLSIPLARWMLIWIPALGGLISGLIVFNLAPETEGHGTDAMVDSFHRKKGIVRKRVPVVKTIASAITIGSGGSAGKEGPIAQIGSGFASILATFLKMGDHERRIMLLAGAAGGLGAIFKAPLGSALFATEVLYREPEFEFEAIIPCIISSIVGYTVFTYYYGWGTIFHIPDLSFSPPGQLPLYGLMGLLCAAVGYFYIRFFYGIRDRFFKKISIPQSLKPALGGLLLGIVAFFFPRILGGGYESIQFAIDGQMAFGLMLVLAFAKILATSFTISSGGSGGVFAPSLFIGSMLGGFYGDLCHKWFPHLVSTPAPFVLVGMGGFFAGIAKVPIAALIMLMEMTGGYHLVVPLLIVSTISYLLLGESSLYEKQVATRVDSPAHLGDFAVDLLDHITVRETLPADREIETVPEDMPFDEIVQLIVNSNQSNFPVLNKDRQLTGILSLTDMRRVILEKELHHLVIAKDVAIEKVITITPEDTLNEALKKMTLAEIRELPVVSRDDPRHLIGMLSRKDILRTYHNGIEAVKHGSV
jgi:chloride channel protein, CIC family